VSFWFHAVCTPGNAWTPFVKFVRVVPKFPRVLVKIGPPVGTTPSRSTVARKVSLSTRRPRSGGAT
jgi:hypothetical protein